MKKLFRCLLTCACMSLLTACSDTPECWDNQSKQTLTELLKKTYFWDKLAISDNYETDSNVDTRICVATVVYENILRPGTVLFNPGGTEQVRYKIKAQRTEKHGKRAFIEILATHHVN